MQEYSIKQWTFERSWLRQNQSYDGGGLAVGDSGYANVAEMHYPQVYDSCWSGNVSSQHGGGVVGKAMMYGCTLSGNSAGQQGGGAYEVKLLAHCTVTQNTAGVFGGGVNYASSVSCVLAGNTAPLHPDTPATIGGGSNFIGVLSATDWLRANNLDTFGTALNPLDPMLGPLQDNGGPTPTHMPLNGSPLIDAGAPNWAEMSYALWNVVRLVDQRGLSRVVDHAAIPNANGSDGSDIGAVEVQMPWTFARPIPEVQLRAANVGAASAPARLVLSATGMLVVGIDPPFEVSRQPTDGFGRATPGDAPPATSAFYVRYRPLSGTRHSGTLTVRVPGGPSQHIPVHFAT
jgi:hypothetical protein